MINNNTHTTTSNSSSSSEAYRQGYRDGLYGEEHSFTENGRLAQLETPAKRLDYYRGHRAGRETRQRDGRLLGAS